MCADPPSNYLHVFAVLTVAAYPKGCDGGSGMVGVDEGMTMSKYIQKIDLLVIFGLLSGSRQEWG